MDDLFKILRPAEVKYQDLCQYEDVSIGEGLEEDLAIMSVFGLVHQTERLTRVFFYIDHSHDEENACIVIPNTDVVEITYFESSSADIMNDEEVN